MANSAPGQAAAPNGDAGHSSLRTQLDAARQELSEATGRGLGGFRYEMLPVRIDEPLLQEIAQKTGGRYFRAKDSEALSRIFRQIDALEKTPIQVTRYTRYDETTRPLILLGLGALALELLIATTLVVRVP